MASKKENLKNLFSNTKTRIIVLFTGVLIIIGILVGVLKLRTTPLGAGESSIAPSASGIQSIPGSLNPTEQYAKLVAQRNVEAAQQAKQTGSSAIPTIIRTQLIGAGGINNLPDAGQGGVGFSTLARQKEGLQKDLWIQNLKSSNCSAAAIKDAVSQGATVNDLKEACSCVQLKANNYGAGQLKPVCSCTELKSAGFDALALKNVGFDAGQLRMCGFDACQLRSAGFSAADLARGGFSDGEMKGAGFPDNEIKAALGLPDNITADDVRKAGCSVEALKKLRAAGVSAAAIRRISGCSAAQLKAAGYTAKELKDAGFTAGELAAAGFSAKDLADAGFTPDEISKAMTALNDAIKKAGCDPNKLRELRLQGVTAEQIVNISGCSRDALKAAGYSDEELKNILPPGSIPDSLKNEIKNAGCDPNKLRALRLKGVKAEQIVSTSGCSRDDLKAAGYSDEDLKNIPATAGLPNNLSKLDCSVASLKAARARGMTAAEIRKTAGCSAAQMKAAGFTAKELKDAGFTAAELKAAGFSPKELKDAGFSAKDLKDAGFSAAELKAAGFSPKELKDAGFSAKDLKDAGFSAAELKAAGFSPKELKDAGFTAAQLRAAGFSAKDLKDAGFSPKELKDAGFSAGELKDAGFSAAELKAAGFSPLQLKSAGFSALDLARAGFSAAELGSAGFSPMEIQAAMDQLRSGMPGLVGGGTPTTPLGAKAPPTAANQQLQQILQRQATQMSQRKSEQAIQSKASEMSSKASQLVNEWSQTPSQTYVAGTPPEEKEGKEEGVETGRRHHHGAEAVTVEGTAATAPAVIKAGDIMFAVLDTSINSDEPGPILATIVSGKLKGSKLIGSFVLPQGGQKMIISFNNISIPSAPKTFGVNAVAIDPETARTALSSHTNNHYLSRYGALFASSFLQGFGQAFQSANTTITIGGNSGNSQYSIAQGIGNSTLENAVIGLTQVGKAWGQVAQRQFNRQPTVQVYAGTGIGILFLQDIKSFT